MKNRNIILAFDYLLKRPGMKYIGAGCSRVTLGNGRFIYKIPRNETCFLSNIREAAAFEDIKLDKLAEFFNRPKLIQLFGVPIIVMEQLSLPGNNKSYCNMVDELHAYSNWCKVSHYLMGDSIQAGKNCKGQIKIFDFASNSDASGWDGELDRQFLNQKFGEEHFEGIEYGRSFESEFVPF